MGILHAECVFCKSSSSLSLSLCLSVVAAAALLSLFSI